MSPEQFSQVIGVLTEIRDLLKPRAEHVKLVSNLPKIDDLVGKRDPDDDYVPNLRNAAVG